MSRHLRWTPEDEAVLMDGWGGRGGLPGLARKLGRSVNAVKVRGARLHLGPWLDGGEYISLYQLMRIVLGLEYVGSYTWYVERWARMGLKIRNVRVDGCLWRVVRIDDFWPWAETNQAALDFSRFERNALGAEPEWADAKRRCDCRNRLMAKKCPWTDEELQLLREMIFCGTTYPQLAATFRRSAGAIRWKIYDLGLPSPNRCAMVAWTDEDMRRLNRMLSDGVSIDRAAKDLGRSPEAVRGKVDWMKKKGIWED